MRILALPTGDARCVREGHDGEKRRMDFMLWNDRNWGPEARLKGITPEKKSGENGGIQI
jgi:hypothetical protein